MRVKTMAGLLVLVCLVTAVAVRGSRAQPLSEASTAFRQCHEAPARTSGRCVPVSSALMGLADMGVDGDTAYGGDYGGDHGGDYSYGRQESLSSPEWWREVALAVVTAGIQALALEVAKWAGERLGGEAPGQLQTQLVPELFDPAP
jgi:hypothetical protein